MRNLRSLKEFEGLQCRIGISDSKIPQNLTNSSNLASLINKKGYDREKIIKENLKKIKEIYNWKNIVNEYETYFKEILSGTKD